MPPAVTLLCEPVFDPGENHKATEGMEQNELFCILAAPKGMYY
jgi:hypothetical protein